LSPFIIGAVAVSLTTAEEELGICNCRSGHGLLESDDNGDLRELQMTQRVFDSS